MDNYAVSAIQATTQGQMAYCKFLSANDTGLTGGHQSGINIAKPAVPIIFDTPGVRGSNKDRWVRIQWQDDLTTDSRFIYYGVRTRNEYRLTNFGRGFPFLRPEFTGSLFVMVKMAEEDYKGYFLNTEDEINQYLEAFNISPTETNRLIDIHGMAPEMQENVAMDQFIASLDTDFPASDIMSAAARSISEQVYHDSGLIVTNPDRILLSWTDMEYKLFRQLEHVRYFDTVAHGFADLEAFISMANQVLNRRKSRAGKSLEHHLSAIFDGNHIEYTAQAVTEGNKRPDFIFPSQVAYHDISFPTDRLASLAAKTTCKDRWRQVLNEADRLRGKNKYLCTLQQGISSAQLDEMNTEGVVLVVPKPYITTYPTAYQDSIWPISKFVGYVQELER